MPRFESATRKVANAREHYGQLARLINSFTSEKPAGAELHALDSGGAIRLNIREDKVPPEIALTFGDCIHNLRSALDHLVYEVVGKAGMTNTEWPMGNADGEIPSDWRKRIRERACSGRSPGTAALREYLYSLKPCIGGEHQWMWLLHRLDVIDKHRLLLATHVIVNKVRIKTEVDLMSWDEEGGPSVLQAGIGLLDLTYEPFNTGPLVDGAIFHAYSAEEWPKIRDVEMRFGIGLWEPTLPLGAKTLEQLANEFMTNVDETIRTVDRLTAEAVATQPAS